MALRAGGWKMTAGTATKRARVVDLPSHYKMAEAEGAAHDAFERFLKSTDVLIASRAFCSPDRVRWERDIERGHFSEADRDFGRLPPPAEIRSWPRSGYCSSLGGQPTSYVAESTWRAGELPVRGTVMWKVPSAPVDRINREMILPTPPVPGTADDHE